MTLSGTEHYESRSGEHYDRVAFTAPAEGQAFPKKSAEKNKQAQKGERLPNESLI